MLRTHGQKECKGAIYTDFDALIERTDELGLNLYDIALYTEEDGNRLHKFQPCNNANDSYSVAKAFVATAFGMLWDEGRIDLNATFGSIFGKDIPSDADPNWQNATIEHAMTHRLGLAEGFLDIDKEDVTQYPAGDWLNIVWRHALPYPPGTHTQYSDAAFYLLSRTFSRIAGENVDVFLGRRLFAPMDFREAAWSCCPLHYPIGATGLYISSGDAVKLAALYMNGGVWAGRRYLSRAWVKTMIAREYELHPYTQKALLFGKRGMHGQGIAFCPTKRFAVAWHAYEKEDRMLRLLDLLDTICEE